MWEVVMVARPYGLDPGRTAEHLEWSQELVVEALAYAEAYPEEVDPIVSEVESKGIEQLRRSLPWVEVGR